MRFSGAKEALKTVQETAWTVPTLLSRRTTSWCGRTWLVGESERNIFGDYFLFHSDHNANGEKIAPLCQRGDLQPDGSTTTTTISSTTTTTQALATTTSDEVFECPLGWSQFNSSCYWIVFEEVDWVEAFNGCQQLHPASHLASSRSESENDFIAHLHTEDIYYYYFWLGGTDSDVEGSWTWTDGTPFDYTRWYSGEGSDGTGHNCLAVNSGTYSNSYFKYWYDLGCFDSHSYICEINLDN